MGNKFYKIYKNAFEEYLKINHLFTNYEGSISFTKEFGSLNIFDVPDGYVSDGLKSGDHWEWTKRVLIARIGEDGNVIVDETEYTHKYLKKIAKTA